MLVRNEVITAAIEATYGVDALPTAANAILVQNLNWATAGARMNERNGLKATLGKVQSVYGGHLKSITFDCEIKGSGTADVAPEIGVLLRGCAFGESIVVATSVTYAPVSQGHESLTLYYYQDGKRHRLTGARGTVSFNAEAGGICLASFTFTGHDTESDVPLISPTYDSTVPAPFIGASFAIGTYSAVISKLAVDMGITVAMPPDVNSANGYGEIRVTERNVTGSFDPEMVLKATYDFQGQWEAGTTFALDTGVIGAAAGNQWQMQLPAIYHAELGPGEREGLRTYEDTFGAAEVSGDDEFSLIFT